MRSGCVRDCSRIKLHYGNSPAPLASYQTITGATRVVEPVPASVRLLEPDPRIWLNTCRSRRCRRARPPGGAEAQRPGTSQTRLGQHSVSRARSLAYHHTSGTLHRSTADSRWRRGTARAGWRGRAKRQARAGPWTGHHTPVVTALRCPSGCGPIADNFQGILLRSGRLDNFCWNFCWLLVGAQGLEPWTR
jgi:hypothetical protein